MGILNIRSGQFIVQQGATVVSGIAAGGACVTPSNYVADVLADSPMGYWQLNDASGSAVIDSSGNGRDGVYIESGIGPLYQQPGPFGIGDCCWTDEAVGAGNSYIRFDTTDFDAIIGAPSQPYTFEIWQRAPTTASGDPNGVFDKTDTSPANWNIMQVLTDGRVNIQLFDGSNNPSVSSAGSVEGTSWFHLVFVREISTPRILLYVNGVLEGTDPAAAAIDTSNTTKLSIGSREAGGSRHINHAVAHAAVYDTALSAARILSHYNTGTTSP